MQQISRYSYRITIAADLALHHELSSRCSAEVYFTAFDYGISSQIFSDWCPVSSKEVYWHMCVLVVWALNMTPSHLFGGRRGGLVVSALYSGSRGPGSSPAPGRVIVLFSWARHFTLTVPPSTQEYKWVPANCRGNLTKYWEVTCDGLASHPGGVAILLVTSCYRNRDKLQQ